MKQCFLNQFSLINMLNYRYFSKPVSLFRSRLFLKISFLTGFLILTFSESFADQPDEVELIHSWKLIDLYTAKERVEIDTSIYAFHVHNPVFRRSVSSSYLGNAGLAAMSNYFSDRGLYRDFFFMDHFSVYLRDPSETEYYNTRRPFSLLDFSTGGPRDQNEKILSVLHTQNVTPEFNIGFRYLNINSDGHYQQQAAVTNAISLFASYEYDNYELHANLNLNAARVFENGGLADDESLYNEALEPQDLSVRLQNVRSGVRNQSLFFSQSWQPFLYSGNDTLDDAGSSWIERFEIFHVFHFDHYKRTYEDDNPQSGFYPEVLINSNRTFDSLYYRSLTNTLMLQLPEFSRGIVNFNAKGGIKHELTKGNYNIPADTTFLIGSGQSAPPYYFLPEPSDTLVKDREEHKYGTSGLTAFARGSIGDVFGIWGKGIYYLQGYKSGEYELQAGISFDLFEGKNRSLLEASIKQKETTPSLFFRSFSSNHFSWENDFRRTGETGIGGSISMPERNFMVYADFDLINNYIYFDETANPQQYGDIIPVIGLSLKKDIPLWKFNFRNIINYQISGNQDILPLPDISLYHSTWFEQTLIRDILNMQIGFDIYYATGYYGYAYQPATSQFYLQDERPLENYPYLDVFINFKHKRTRMFFKAEHLNAGYLDPEYFSVLHYPRKQQMFKFGLSWSFYN